MAGHSPPATVAAVQARYADAGGATTMMPTEDAAVVAAELTRRFGVSAWSFALTATDANRWALRLCRALTGRPKVLVNAWCYHGSVDESLIVTSPDGPGGPPGQRRRALRRDREQPGRRVQRPRRPGGASWPTATWPSSSWSRP